MNFVVLPSERLVKTVSPKLTDSSEMSYLSNPESSPLFLPQEFQSSLGGVKVVHGDFLQHILGKLNMAVFVF